MFGDLRDDLESQVTSTHELQWKTSSMHAGKGVSTQERKSVTQGLDESQTQKTSARDQDLRIKTNRKTLKQETTDQIKKPRGEHHQYT